MDPHDRRVGEDTVMNTLNQGPARAVCTADCAGKVFEVVEESAERLRVLGVREADIEDNHDCHRAARAGAIPFGGE